MRHTCLKAGHQQAIVAHTQTKLGAQRAVLSSAVLCFQGKHLDSRCWWFSEMVSVKCDRKMCISPRRQRVHMQKMCGLIQQDWQLKITSPGAPSVFERAAQGTTQLGHFATLATFLSATCLLPIFCMTPNQVCLQRHPCQTKHAAATLIKSQHGRRIAWHI